MKKLILVLVGTFFLTNIHGMEKLKEAWEQKRRERQDKKREALRKKAKKALDGLQYKQTEKLVAKLNDQERKSLITEIIRNLNNILENDNQSNDNDKCPVDPALQYYFEQFDQNKLCTFINIATLSQLEAIKIQLSDIQDEQIKNKLIDYCNRIINEKR